MTPSTLAAAAAPAHVEAFCSTGTSPGRVVTTHLSFESKFGGRLRTDVTYELHGPPNARPIVVLGGISAGHHLSPTEANASPGWWPGVVEDGGALDPRRHRLLGIDFLGGPESRTPAPRDPVSSHDQARALTGVLDELGLDRVTIVGASYGGMVALAFAEIFPKRVRSLVVLGAAHRTHPMATALRAIQRRAATLASEGDGCAGLALARALAMTTYRSPEEFEARFDSRPTCGPAGFSFPVEEYLDARGAAFSERFDADSFVQLSESIDLHVVDPAGITVRTTLVSFDTDALVPQWLAEELAATAPGVERHVTLESQFGHDAFLKEVELVSDVIRTAIDGPEVAR